jgi:acetylornithine deacetylase/succinyl-diaminopimelate desuccinylase-like protein
VLDAKALLGAVDARRIASDLWRLVEVPSPTGRERPAALVFAELLSAAGAEVELDETIPESPNVIGRLRGRRPGRVFQFGGHLDHIDVPHPPPECDAESVSGRGAADMKGGLAVVLEAVRALTEAGRDFSGEVLVTAWGLHEAPVGDSRGLLNLIRRRVVGDAALVTENVHSAREKAVVAGKGQGIWHLTLRWTGAVGHELCRPPDADGLLRTVLEAAGRLGERSQELAAGLAGDSDTGPGSLFVGQMHYGDFYNRTAGSCTLQGTRRWPPSQTSAEIALEIEDFARAIPCAPNVSAEVRFQVVGEAYRMGPAEPVVAALRSAWREVHGSPMELGGLDAVTDANRLVPLAGVPTVLLECDNRLAHADREVVHLARLSDSCRVALGTVMRYLEGGHR